MKDKYNIGEDVLMFLRSRHTGAENAVPGAEIGHIFGINGTAVRQIVNNLRCEGQPVCSNTSGYFYAENSDEINDTVQHLLGRAAAITETAQGLVLSHQVFFDGTAVIDP